MSEYSNRNGISDNRPVIAAFAEQFTHSADPQAVISVPEGCVVVAVNVAHAERYPDSGEVFDGKPHELLSLLETFCPTPKSTCYCEVISAVDVLDLKDCAFHKIFASDQGQGVQSRVDFRSISPDRQIYEVCGVAGWRLTTDRDMLAVIPPIRTPFSSVVDSEFNSGVIPERVSASLYSPGRSSHSDVYLPHEDDCHPYKNFAKVMGDLRRRFADGDPPQLFAVLRASVIELQQQYEQGYPERQILGSLVTAIESKNIELIGKELDFRIKTLFDAKALNVVVQNGIGLRREVAESIEEVPVPDSFRPVRKKLHFITEPGGDRLAHQFLSFESLTTEDVDELDADEKEAFERLRNAGYIVGADEYELTSQFLIDARQDTSRRSSADQEAQAQDSAAPADASTAPIEDRVDLQGLEPLYTYRCTVKDPAPPSQPDLVEIEMELGDEKNVRRLFGRASLKDVYLERGARICYQVFSLGTISVAKFAPLEGAKPQPASEST